MNVTSHLKEGIVAAIITLTEIDVSEEDELPKYICRSCAGNYIKPEKQGG